jgi:hypothetical protein
LRIDRRRCVATLRWTSLSTVLFPRVIVASPARPLIYSERLTVAIAHRTGRPCSARGTPPARTADHMLGACFFYS